jgi:hypothetical protein
MRTTRPSRHPATKSRHIIGGIGLIFVPRAWRHAAFEGAEK